jgi:hypothetical protein
MKNKILTLTAFCLIFMSGCGNLSPRQDQEIDNSNGKIDEIKNNQNGIMSELGTLKNQQEIQNSRLDRVQQGMMNIQSNYENSGVQIFSGPGGLIVAIVGFICSTILVLHYRLQAKTFEKTSSILAERIVNTNDPELEDQVFQAAMYTNVEENVLNLMKKAKAKSML